MKRIYSIVVALLFVGLNPVLAQGTAFTYQGRLNDGAGPVNGNYDLRFGIFDAVTNGNQQGIYVTNSATPVSAGLFTVILDFGNQFSGPNRWLEIAVRTNGVGAFTNLAPRQPVLPSPYAIFASEASNLLGGVSASQVAGTLSTTQLPSGVLTNGASSINLTGLFSGNGAGLTNVPGALPWLVVSNNVQLLPNKGYMLLPPATAALLPANPAVGDVVRICFLDTNPNHVVNISQNSGQQILAPLFNAENFTGSLNFYGAAASADGARYFLAGFNAALSTNSGASWTYLSPGAFNFFGVACSADGMKVVMVSSGGQIYTSTDGGSSWTARDSSRSWFSVASSTDGAKLVGTVANGQIYTSTDSGVTWTPRDSSRNWSGIASSADGTRLVAAVNGGRLYTSSDSGLTWTNRAVTNNWYSVAASSDGSRLVAVGFGAQIYTSTDYGTNWTPRAFVGNWRAAASSTDGKNLAVGAYGGFIFTSSDYGTNWVQRFFTDSYRCIASSADGTQLIAACDPGFIYYSTNSGVSWFNKIPGTTVGSSGYLSTFYQSGAGGYGSIELIYIGNGQFAVLNHDGNFTSK